jgi:hypothetical protein
MHITSNRSSARPQGLSHVAATFPSVLGCPATSSGAGLSSQPDLRPICESGGRLGICDSGSLQQATPCPTSRRRTARQAIRTSAASSSNVEVGIAEVKVMIQDIMVCKSTVCHQLLTNASALQTSQLRLIHPAYPPGPASNLLVFLPGTDGTGQVCEYGRDPCEPRISCWSPHNTTLWVLQHSTWVHSAVDTQS